ncbi:hypothetical protein DW228_18480 [Bacteroides fragilis]|uniref:Uncharacterized protein n=1 Tax=Bacteroides fragilis TaxID=817 RepID=A0A396BPK9_BACFG|nr:hypothetical protein [Bacteroides fragilis]RHH07920.1 hypothetical protein DW228_18480 [Bacteroides fragilis]
MMNFSADITTIAIPFIVAILGLSIPLLLQVVARIDDKYSSVGLVDSFYKEKKVKYFNTTLKIAISLIVLLLIWALFISASQDYKAIWELVTYVSLFLATGVLIYFLFTYVELIKTYYIPLNLLEHLKKSHREDAFNSISELLYYSIKNQNENLGKSLYSFIADYVILFRKGKSGEITYSNDFYAMLYQANELIATSPTKLISYYNGNTLLELLLDEYQGTRLSSDTYKTLWICLTQQAYYNRKDLILSYWTIAHQYILLFRQEVYPVYDKDLHITNKEEVSVRKNEREQFLKFHYAFGGLLVYLEKYDIMQGVILHTNQKPPKYVLVPTTIGEVIKRYIEIEANKLTPYIYSMNYPFPGNSSINSDEIIKRSIRRYLVILLLYQYIKQGQSYGANPLSLPTIPDELEELSFWKEELNFLEKDLADVLSDKSLMQHAGLGILYSPSDSDWFTSNSKEPPVELVGRLIKLVDAAYKIKRKISPLDTDKIKVFKENAQEIVRESIERMNLLNNPGELGSSDIISYNIDPSVYQIMDKRAFAIESDIGFLGTEYAVAKGVATNYEYSVTQTFNDRNVNHYLIERESIFKAIEKLNINANKHVIICFGVNLMYFKENLGIVALTNYNGQYSYRTIPVINIDKNMLGVEPNTFIIMQKEDLPKIQVKNSKSEYSLTKVDEEYSIYADVISFEERKDIRVEYENRINTETLDNSVLACVEMIALVQWKKDAKYVSLRVYNQFLNSSKANTLDDIEPF